MSTPRAEVPARDAGPFGGRAGVLAAAAIVAAVVMALGVVLGAWLGAPSDDAGTPDADAVDVGFARDMKTHHAQAVEMSRRVREATQDPEVRTLALDIMLTQQQQIGQMYAWLELWGVSQTSSSASPMSWMQAPGEAMPDMAAPEAAGGQQMPGMASREDMQALAGASGETAERIYLQLMIPHHQGGLGMAREASERAEQPQVRRLARAMLNAQAAEIRVLEEMLAARGGPVDLDGQS